MKIAHVVAVADNNAIGLKGQLLWNLPKDMKFFTNVTTGHFVLMGRKSWDSLPDKYRPLPGRQNIVVTRQKDFSPEGAIVVGSIEDGMELAEESGEKELMIIGGGEIYKESLPYTDRVYITCVHHTFEDADAFYPQLDPEEWREVSVEPNEADDKHAYDFDFVVLERV